MIRPAGSEDIRFLRDMLHHAFYRRARDTSDERSTYRYVAGWGRPGDAGVIAFDDGHRVGAAWYRLFPESAPGYGFVDAQTPELAIAVVPARRGRGLGRELLEALLELARADGHRALSLSVDRGNPAEALYRRFGFRTVREDGDVLVMRAEL